MDNKMNPLAYLTRHDKWYLGSGGRLVFAPPFPQWLDYPGFWDKAHYYNLEIEPVFTWTLLDEDGKEISMRCREQEWNPQRMISDFSRRFAVAKFPISVADSPWRDVRIIETKLCVQNDTLVSSVRIKNLSKKKRRFHFIAWTTQSSYPSQQSSWLTDIEFKHEHISFTKHIHASNKPHIDFHCSLGMNRKVKSYSINLSEGSIIQPHWKFTPFREKFRNGKLPNDIKPSGIDEDGLMYIALHAGIIIQPKSEKDISIQFSVSQNPPVSKSPLSTRDDNRDNYFSSLPRFHCSDEYFTRYYWYRWYGLRLNTIQPNNLHYKHPVVCEGIGYFRAPITYSAMCHMLETRWMHDPSLAQGSLLTFIDNQREDGGFRGYIDPHYYRQEMFYHANWGRSLLALDQIHSDKKFLRQAYHGLQKYVEYFDRERDTEKSGLYDIQNHYETGQEYMHRYFAVDPNADKDNWGEIFHLKGVDVTVYIYELKRALAIVAKKLKLGDGVMKYWNDGAERIKNSVLEKMWDDDVRMFFDVDPATQKRTMIKAATCFYPYMTDIVSEKHLRGLKKHLLNPEEFWTPFPTPSSSADDSYFSSEAEWKGKRMNCPWNGRTWPMTNSHIAEALAMTAVRFNDQELREKTVEFITKFIRMMFFDGDATRPNCFEHYNPFTGAPSMYRGIDDYQHSWVVDLIITYVAGVRPQENTIIIDPFPFELDEFVIERLRIRGHEIKVERRGKRFRVWVDGKKSKRIELGESVVLDL